MKNETLFETMTSGEHHSIKHSFSPEDNDFKTVIMSIAGK
jgi:hypothetical protein